MKEFNYKRAHTEWAVPEYLKLSREIKALFSRVQNEGGEWHQNHDTSIDWPGEDIKAAFDAIPPDQLAYGMQVIYSLGHWDYTGSDNPTPKDKHGAYWKFEILAKRSLIDRTPRYVWTDCDVSKKFMDHKEGTEYSSDELPDLARQVCHIYEPVEGRAVNFKVKGQPGHPFTIGNGHFTDSPYLDPNAHGCYWQDYKGDSHCGLPYKDHTHDVALLVRGPLPKTDEEKAELEAIINVCKKHNAKIDGIAFIEPKTEKPNDR